MSIYHISCFLIVGRVPGVTYHILHQLCSTHHRRYAISKPYIISLVILLVKMVYGKMSARSQMNCTTPVRPVAERTHRPYTIFTTRITHLSSGPPILILKYVRHNKFEVQGSCCGNQRKDSTQFHIWIHELHMKIHRNAINSGRICELPLWPWYA